MTSRADIVAEARSWIGTPYALNQMCKGAGVDCARFLFAVYRACGLVPDEGIGIFSGDWFCHATEETYMLRIARHAYKAAEAIAIRSAGTGATGILAGNIILSRVVDSRLYNHGAIITAWPLIIHAVHAGVREIDVTRDPMWADEQITVFDPFIKESV